MKQIPVQGGAVFSSYCSAFPAWVLYAAFELIYTSHMHHSLELCHLYWSEEGKKKKKMYFAPERALEILNSLPTYAPLCCIILSNLLFLGMPQFLMWNSFITLIGEVCYPTFHLLSRHTNEQENPHVILTWQSVGLEIKLIARSVLKHGLIEVKVCCCLI